MTALRLSAARGVALALALCAAMAHGATITLNGIARDFNSRNTTFAGVAGHVDFENTTYPTTGEKGLVSTQLGANGKPTLTAGTKSSVASAASFAQWYTTSSINREVPISIVLENSASAPNTYRYTNNAFFPLDGRGFNQQSGPTGNVHNFGFTTEFHTTFVYNAGKGDSFTFTGDDDVFVFINGILAIDLGGVHASQSATVNLDTFAQANPLVSGRRYNLDIFQAERRTTGSNFAITTTLTTIQNVPEPGTLALAGLGLAAAGLARKGRQRAGAACSERPDGG